MKANFKGTFRLLIAVLLCIPIGSSALAQSPGTVWGWGWNSYGQLGNGTMQDKAVPAPIAELSDVIALSGGELFSLALKSNGTVWACGNNWQGQLGIGTFAMGEDPGRPTFAQVPGLTDVISILEGLE